ncbi:unnamed protein product [Phytophthora fragariaefolia]|uniref:Unnamed protein product n=1 Tax=Phytophthora fragariaefolia TaxID=1490495 RepID=A0A9W7D1H9_9STRA|nr:unnamed protein product [Phytophthora fragariaefolia]
MDENAVAPRLIWSDMLRAPELQQPVLGFPSPEHDQRNVRYSRWLQGSKNSIIRSQELVRSKAYTHDLNPDTAFAFGNR